MPKRKPRWAMERYAFPVFGAEAREPWRRRSIRRPGPGSAPRGRRLPHSAAVRSAAEPPDTPSRVPVSVSFPSSDTRSTCTSRSTMLPTRSVRPSGEKATPCAQAPTRASETTARRPSAMRSIRTRPGPWKGEPGGLLEPFTSVTAAKRLSGLAWMPSGVWPTLTVSTTRQGSRPRSIRLTVSASPVPRPILATSAQRPSGVIDRP